MRIALAQVDPTVGDLSGNAALTAAWVEKAVVAGADMVVFPELVICGYPPEDLVLRDYFLADCRQALLEVAESCQNLVAVVGTPLREDGMIYNAAAIIWNRQVVGWYRKIILPDYAGFDEKRYFTPGENAVVVEIGGTRVGLTIAEDLEGSGAAAVGGLSERAEVIVNLAMSPYYRGRGRVREEKLAERARSLGTWVCWVNGVGGQDDLVFDGHSLVFDPQGGLRARAPQFKEALLLVDVHPQAGSRLHRGLPMTESRPVNVIAIHPDGSNDADSLPAKPAVPPPSVSPDLAQPLSPEAEVYSALCLGVRDYIRKNRFEQVVLGISGGLDSALTACIAVDALGADKVHMVSMPSRYSSKGTKNDARETAKRLGAKYYEIPIEPIYTSYLDSLALFLDSDTPGVTEQNIQARIRGNLLMALSNQFGWLVLTTGNKSETAVGYTTLYGDMAGGFAVLKDVPKTLVYRLADYRNAIGPGEGPIPESTIRRPPSAELAPDQTDQDTLPPYELLDEIVEAYVVRDESPDELAVLGSDRALVRRVVGMIDGSEHKRRQGPPGVRISPKGFGKDRQLPITNRYRK